MAEMYNVERSETCQRKERTAYTKTQNNWEETINGLECGLSGAKFFSEIEETSL